MYILNIFIQHTMHLDETQKLKKFSSHKISDIKMPSFLFHELQLLAVLLLTYNSNMR